MASFRRVPSLGRVPPKGSAAMEDREVTEGLV